MTEVSFVCYAGGTKALHKKYVHPGIIPSFARRGGGTSYPTGHLTPFFPTNSGTPRSKNTQNSDLAIAPCSVSDIDSLSDERD